MHKLLDIIKNIKTLDPPLSQVVIKYWSIAGAIILLSIPSAIMTNDWVMGIIVLTGGVFIAIYGIFLLNSFLKGSYIKIEGVVKKDEANSKTKSPHLLVETNTDNYILYLSPKRTIGFTNGNNVIFYTNKNNVIKNNTGVYHIYSIYCIRKTASTT